MIHLTDIGKTFDALDGSQVEALHNICLDVGEGEFVSIVGPSGCGKTTILEIIAGLQKPSRGKVQNSRLSGNGTFGWAGYMSQNDTLLPWRTVMDNITIGLEIRGVPRSLCKQKVAPLIEQMGLAGFENNYPSELSGGMKKRLGLIRMLAYEPEVLLLDEPFAALDAQSRESLQKDLLNLWRQYRRTIIFVTHDLVEAITLSDRIYLLSRRPACIKQEYQVNLSRPRQPELTQFSQKFQTLHRKIRLDLMQEIEPGCLMDQKILQS